MKTSAVILCLLYLVSSFSPVFVSGDVEPVVAKTSCCSKSAAKECAMPDAKKVEQKNGCEDENNSCEDCSVLACPLCPYILAEAPVLDTPQIPVHENEEPFNNINLSTFHGEYWHPPEFLLV